MQNKVTKQDWIAMFKDIGLDDETMLQWHKLFETRHPEGHEDFLKWLGLPAQEVDAIRTKCR
ncbi:MAG: hypothetical protein OET90_00300 [Desulfuromonadales bacterium]|nr:hypothetical protein [Desulfuromonadales bacterium]